MLTETEPNVERFAHDPLRCSLELQHERLLYAYGLPVRIKSNHIAPILVAENSWGSCQSHHAEQPVEIRIVVSEAPGRRKPPEPAYRAQSNLLTIVADAKNYACCDLARGLGFAELSPAAIRNRSYLRYYFIEAMAYTLLDALHLVMLHAGCASFHGKGFIFVGDSGAGKSSLTYACARRGWAYLSDDATAILRRSQQQTVVGNPRTIRFRPAATALFPEISGPVKLRNGKPTIEVLSKSLPGITSTDCCNVGFMLFLKRSSELVGEPMLVPIAKESAFQRLFYSSFPSELGIGEERFRAVDSIVTAARTFEFVYSDLTAAVDRLEGLAGTI